MTSISPSISRLRSPFLCCPLKISSSSHFSLRRSSRNQRSLPSYPCVRADFDQNTVRFYFLLLFFYFSFHSLFINGIWFCNGNSNLQLVAISVGVVSVAVGIGIPIFYETQIDNAVSIFPQFFTGAFYLFDCSQL